MASALDVTVQQVRDGRYGPADCKTEVNSKEMDRHLITTTVDGLASLALSGNCVVGLRDSRPAAEQSTPPTDDNGSFYLAARLLLTACPTEETAPPSSAAPGTTALAIPLQRAFAS